MTPIRSQTQCNKIELYSGSSCFLLLFFAFVLVFCMVINVSVPYKGAFLLDVILLALLLPSGNPIKCQEKVLPLQPMFLPPKRFDNFPLCMGDAQKV